LFCQQNIGLFAEVQALTKGTDLSAYAASKQLLQPIDVSACASPVRTAQASSTRR
jgi:hypothetical protein